jgi:DNA mismatch endonuclease (patch repair protein)
MDKITPIRRSENMRRIRSKNTKPEIFVRKIIKDMGIKGYRLHSKNIPGTPDLVWVKQKVAIFINGCFWHGHTCKEGKRRPKSRLEYWLPKIERTQKRDRKYKRQLKALNWKVLTIWDCQLKNACKLENKLRRFLK